MSTTKTTLALALLIAACDLSPPADPQTVAFTTSRPCVMCHPDHYASWHRTFHRTMTQLATPETVLGDFENRRFTFEGVTSRFTRPNGNFAIETLDPATNELRTFPISRTIGSRRVQQYLTRAGDRYLRLPLAWNIAEKRWFHLNGGFLHPDGANFHAHTSLWDGNCIFCHNTAPNPGYDRRKQTYSSSVAELGIACEACHGPGEEHAARNSSPIRRYYLHNSSERDATIISPLELDKTKSVQICGRCHGQRVPRPQERILQFLEDGDPFRPGEDLSRVTSPIFRDTKLEGVDLSLRFWSDGTPRLTAYEYQGLLMSKDHQRGELTCISCHTMHGGDPRGMIEPEKRGAAACAPCHPSLVANAAKHAKHREGSTGTDCYACHMPKIVFGIMEIHKTHRIQNPDPSRAWIHRMPEACTLCHLDKSAKWAAKIDAPDELPESVRALFAGDVVHRAVVASAFGEERSYTEDPRARLWAVPILLTAIERDRYPAVRRLAFRSLRALIDRAGLNDAPREDFDFQARPRPLTAWREWWAKQTPPARPQIAAETIEALLREQKNETIAIGE